jgi:FG-GAP repeat
LQPELDYRYQLTLGATPFAMKVQNGLRSKSGAAYGDGALYTIEYGGQRFEYLLGGFGWGSSVSAIADLDGDGKPDFIISVDGSNSGSEYVLLSSLAKPGRNVPTASLYSQGC